MWILSFYHCGRATWTVSRLYLARQRFVPCLGRCRFLAYSPFREKRSSFLVPSSCLSKIALGAHYKAKERFATVVTLFSKVLPMISFGLSAGSFCWVSRCIRRSGFASQLPVSARGIGSSTKVSKIKDLTKQQISSLTLLRWEGRTEVLSRHKSMNEAVASILNAREKVVGFDVEMTAGNHPVLVQLATGNCAYLFRILDGDATPLMPILESERVLKVGVGVNNDARKLQKQNNFNPKGFREIAQLTRELGLQNHGLRSLAAAFLGRRVSKISPGNWTSKDLTAGQIRYAATDAFVSREIFLNMPNGY